MATVNTRYPDAAKMFALDSQGNQMTVLHDDGVYRHIRFRRPDTSLYWYSLITWPGSLCLQGDVGTWVFSRTTDMVEFFNDGPTADINPGYWGEKVTTGEVRTYDPDLARSHVTDLFREYADDHGWPLLDVADLWADLEENVLVWAENEEQFREALDNFRWASVEEPDEELPPLPAFRFTDTWEWDLTGFKFQFLWACFAVRDGVNRYLTSKNMTQPLPKEQYL